jgi:hypothetical protein
LDAIPLQIAGRPYTRDELATRELIVIRPTPGFRLDGEKLRDMRADVQLVSQDPDTRTVLLDASTASLDYLRKKIEAFADDRLATTKVRADGTSETKRKNAAAVAPIESVSLATLADLRGPQLRADHGDATAVRWFEIACRGGYRRPPAEAAASRAQVERQLAKLGLAATPDEFFGPEHVYFFVRASTEQMATLQARTDCIFEIELAPPPIRDLCLFDHLSTADLDGFALTPPPADAPAVVLLDTGVATEHPMLRSAILTATTAGPEIPSPEDTYGHGTLMSGVALLGDVGAAVAAGGASPTHWLQSSRLMVTPGRGTAADENHENWPVLTLGAVRSAEAADPGPRQRAFALAVTRSMQVPPLDDLIPTLWSHGIDQLAYNGGNGRLMIVAAGNARYEQWLSLAESHPDLQLSEKIHQPSQAVSALTVGAYTTRTALPATRDYAEYLPVARSPGGISPYTSTGLTGAEWAIKPDVVMEGGNLAIAGTIPNSSVPTLAALTTSNRHSMGEPVGLLSMTSEATARAARLAARIWSAEPDLRPESVRALIVHSASWTRVMTSQFPAVKDRLLACGYGVPSEALAVECALGRATVVIEDTMPNAVIEEEPKKKAPVRPETRLTEPRIRRRLKVFRMPIPVDLIADGDPDVELRVTLSYYPEPNKFGRSVFHGLDLKWDMQGPSESEDAFLRRINALRRPKKANGRPDKVPTTKSFPWDLGISTRSRGTVQSDRWRGKMSALVGDKLIAVIPVLGWWDHRKPLREQAQRFSLVVSVMGPGVYAAIRPKLALPVDVQIDV